MQQTTFFLALCGLLTTGSGATAAPPLPRKVSVPVGPDRLTAYLALPEGRGPFPAVLFLHGGRGGIVGGDPQQSAQALAHAGYVALIQTGSRAAKFCVLQHRQRLPGSLWMPFDPDNSYVLDPPSAFKRLGTLHDGQIANQKPAQTDCNHGQYPFGIQIDFHLTLLSLLIELPDGCNDYILGNPAYQ